MADVYVRFSNEPVVRTMLNEEQDIRCDVGDNGELIGVALSGAISVTIDGRELATARPRAADYPEAAS